MSRVPDRFTCFGLGPEAETRRSFEGTRPPLHQGGYMPGDIQFVAPFEEFLDGQFGDVVRRLGIPAGQELLWIEDRLGGFRVVPNTPELAEAMDAHEAVMAEYDSVFRELAK